MAHNAPLVRKKCPRCKSLYLVSLPRKKGLDTEVGVCPSIVCWAIRTYNDDEWRAKADMARIRRDIGTEIEVQHVGFDVDGKPMAEARTVALQPNAFDAEALRRFP